MSHTAILKSLSETTFDSIQGYRKASDLAESPRLTRVLEERAQMRGKTLDKLNTELVRFGEDPVTSSSGSGWMHRKFVEITNLFGSGDETAVEGVDEGEDYIAKKFEEAIKDDDLDMETRRVITDAYGEIKEGKRMSDRLEKAYA